MKGYKKALLASLATIGTSCALLGGATFALFTSESKTNIAVTSGKVDVRAVVDEESLVLTSMGEEMDETFAAGGTAKYVAETNSFEIDGMVAGDHIEFDIAIENHSTVAVKYQTNISFDGNEKLFEALNFELGEEGLTKVGGTYYSNWAEFAKDEVSEITYHVKMGIPESYQDTIVNGDDTNSIQGKECSVIFNVTAVQGNANTYDPVVANPEWDEENIKDVADFLAFRDAVNGGNDFANKTVELKANLDLGGIENWEPIGGAPVSDIHGSTGHLFRGTFKGGDYTISNLTINSPADGNVGLFGFIGKGTEISNFTVKNAKVTGTDYVSAVVAHSTGASVSIHDVTVEGAVLTGGHWMGAVLGLGPVTISDCTVKDVEITATPYMVGSSYDNGDKVGALAGHIDNSSLTISGNTVDGATITGYRDVGGLIGYAFASDTVKNNTVKNVKIIVSDKNGYGKTNRSAGEVVGNRVLGGEEINTVQNVTITRSVADADALADAIASANDGATIALAAGTYKLSSAAQNKELTIVGVKGTVIEVSNPSSPAYPDYSLQGSTVTFENLTIKSAGATYTGYAAVAKATYNNCTIEGPIWLYGDSEFNGCTLISTTDYSVYTWGAEYATFNGCTFNSDGKALKLYGTADTVLTVNKCVFNDSTAGNGRKAAIEIADGYGTSYTLYVKDTTVNGFAINTEKGENTYSNVWSNVGIGEIIGMDEEHLHVYIDDELVYGTDN